MASEPRTKPSNAAEIDRLALALAKDPGSRAFLPLAEEYGKAGMWQEAAAVLEDGLKRYPGFITAMVVLGRTYEQLAQPAKAKAILEEAVKISPENLRAHRTLAKIYTAQGAHAAAQRSCGVILAANPQDQEALSLRAALASSASRQEDASPDTAQGPATVFSEQDTHSIQRDAAPDRQHHAVVGQLEAWLTSIQTRRRDYDTSHRPDAQSS
jgi:tetratricopeptide (TPR) repeat protein